MPKFLFIAVLFLGLAVPNLGTAQLAKIKEAVPSANCSPWFLHWQPEDAWQQLRDLNTFEDNTSLLVREYKLHPKHTIEVITSLMAQIYHGDRTSDKAFFKNTISATFAQIKQGLREGKLKNLTLIKDILENPKAMALVTPDQDAALLLQFMAQGLRNLQASKDWNDFIVEKTFDLLKSFNNPRKLHQLRSDYLLLAEQGATPTDWRVLLARFALDICGEFSVDKPAHQQALLDIFKKWFPKNKQRQESSAAAVQDQVARLFCQMANPKNIIDVPLYYQMQYPEDVEQFRKITASTDQDGSNHDSYYLNLVYLHFLKDHARPEDERANAEEGDLVPPRSNLPPLNHKQVANSLFVHISETDITRSTFFDILETNQYPQILFRSQYFHQNYLPLLIKNAGPRFARALKAAIDNLIKDDFWQTLKADENEVNDCLFPFFKILEVVGELNGQTIPVDYLPAMHTLVSFTEQLLRRYYISIFFPLRNTEVLLRPYHEMEDVLKSKTSLTKKDQLLVKKLNHLNELYRQLKSNSFAFADAIGEILYRLRRLVPYIDPHDQTIIWSYYHVLFDWINLYNDDVGVYLAALYQEIAPKFKENGTVNDKNFFDTLHATFPTIPLDQITRPIATVLSFYPGDDFNEDVTEIYQKRLGLNLAKSGPSSKGSKKGKKDDEDKEVNLLQEIDQAIRNLGWPELIRMQAQEYREEKEENTQKIENAYKKILDLYPNWLKDTKIFRTQLLDLVVAEAERRQCLSLTWRLTNPTKEQAKNFDDLNQFINSRTALTSIRQYWEERFAADLNVSANQKSGKKHGLGVGKAQLLELSLLHLARLFWLEGPNENYRQILRAYQSFLDDVILPNYNIAYVPDDNPNGPSWNNPQNAPWLRIFQMIANHLLPEATKDYIRPKTHHTYKLINNIQEYLKTFPGNNGARVLQIAPDKITAEDGFELALRVALTNTSSTANYFAMVLCGLIGIDHSSRKWVWDKEIHDISWDFMNAYHRHMVSIIIEEQIAAYVGQASPVDLRTAAIWFTNISDAVPYLPDRAENTRAKAAEILRAAITNAQHITTFKDSEKDALTSKMEVQGALDTFDRQLFRKIFTYYREIDKSSEHNHQTQVIKQTAN